MRALPPVPGHIINGIGLGTFVRAAIRDARARRVGAAEPIPPAPPAAPAAAIPDPVLRFAVLLRGHGLGALYVEASRLAQLAAIHRENVEGLAYGRSYGDRDLARIEPAPCLLPILAEAAARADMAGALADLLKAMIGHEADVGMALMGGAGV